MSDLPAHPAATLPAPAALPERTDIDAAIFEREIEPAARPTVLRGLAADWPAVAAANRSREEIAAYLKRFDIGAPVEAFVGPPQINGRYFYADDMRGFNFRRIRGRLGEALDLLLGASDPEPPSFYIGAAAIPEVMPGFAEANPMPLFAAGSATARAWIGNRSSVAPHFDLSDNIAVVVAGHRRFTLFPPEQVGNLYVGPLDHTMAGQPASMVAIEDPDLDRFPRFREALAAAMTAELSPGDAIYIPSLWWHHVEALDSFNMLVNYWIDPPIDMASPFDAMIHGILAVAALPPERRVSWRALFDNYVFQTDRHPVEHLPPEHRGILAPSSPDLRERMRNFVLRGLMRR